MKRVNFPRDMPSGPCHECKKLSTRVEEDNFNAKLTRATHSAVQRRQWHLAIILRKTMHEFTRLSYKPSSTAVLGLSFGTTRR
ncbi:unnamed protein product [Cuscuta campestris]|nr:unnamed protein product [Cuscuta campestris]